MHTDKSTSTIVSSHPTGQYGARDMPAARLAGVGHAMRPLTWKSGKAVITGWLVTILLIPLFCLAQTPSPMPEAAETIPRAPVTLDGETLFLIRGVSALPADKRAVLISDRILATAKDPGYAIGTLKAIDEDGFTRIEARGQTLLTITNSDGTMEGVARPTLVRSLMVRIDEAITAYRQSRTREALLQGVARAAGALAGFVLLLSLFLWLYRRVEAATERYCQTKLENIRARALPVVKTEQLWERIHGGMRFLRAAFLTFATLLFLNAVLGQFPWTKPYSNRIFELVLDPLRTIGRGVLHSLPDLVFLAVLFFVIRFLLKVVRLAFDEVSRGTWTLKGFDAEWAGPTFRIIRLLIIAFGLVVAYPYLPGSGSEAFKGISLLIGVVFSLGSSGTIANIIAGYSLTYRRAYRVGDRVRIGETIGDVELIRLQVTHVRSLKNEEVIIPNSVILNSSVTNYSTLAKKHGLILHTTVGIGYETPWRQVEAMLLAAAERTPGIMREPPPFVLHSALGDFSVTYELNVYCDRPREALLLYTALHRNILDVFNEHGVQIMTPAYEGDPAEPKIVPKDKWFESPARPPE